MSYDAAKLELGAGSLSIAVYNAAGTSVTPPGIDVGGTDGAELYYKAEYMDMEIDQAMSPVVSHQIGEECTFKITVKEMQMRTLALALNLNPDDAAQLLSTPSVQMRVVFGGKKTPTYAYLTYTVAKVSDTTKNWIAKVYKARCISGTRLAFKKKEGRMIELEFKGFPQSSASEAVAEVIEQI